MHRSIEESADLHGDDSGRLQLGPPGGDSVPIALHAMHGGHSLLGLRHPTRPMMRAVEMLSPLDPVSAKRFRKFSALRQRTRNAFCNTDLRALGATGPGSGEQY